MSQFTKEQIKRFKSKYYQNVDEEHCTNCLMCNKYFYIPEVMIWTYKILNSHSRQKLCCSYKCYREAEKLKQSLSKVTHREEFDEESLFVF